MYKVAVLGERDSIYGFTSVGMEIFPITDPAHAGKLIKTLSEGGYAVIFVTESVYAHLGKELLSSGAPLPAIVPIPGVSGNTGIGIDRVKGFVKQAVGSDILFGNK